ncbi:MAG: hypothetical protein AAF205_04495 [Pseudomonadota bacterium]
MATLPRAQKSFGRAGPLSPARGGYGPRTFAGSNGRFMSVLMRRLEGRTASRWAHIVLRRALLSDVVTPAAIKDGDWIAARAALLTRMGEVDGAKLLIDGLPVDGYTPRLYAAAAQTHMAAGDIPALCPLAPTARALSDARFWRLAGAVCASLTGDESLATTGFNRVRRADRENESGNGFDILLAERVAGIASGIGRAANIDWDDAGSLDSYRFGMAAAGELDIPEDLWRDAPTRIHGWAFRNGQTPLAVRDRVSRTAAAAGIVSARELVALAALRGARQEDGEMPETARLMRVAEVGRTPSERIAAMRTIWDDAGDDADARFAARIATAHAATRIEPVASLAEEAPDLIASMLAAGRYERALAWWPVLARAEDDVRWRGWALLVLADAGGTVPLQPGSVRNAFSALAEGENENMVRGRLGHLVSSLRAMDRIGGRAWNSIYEDFEVRRRDDVHTEALDRAAAAGRRGEVAILSAIGLQGGWGQVRHQDVAPVLDAWNSVGLGAEARMLAVEAYLRGV